MSTALLTDRYELTMLDAALGSGVAHRPAVFEVFARGLPPGRRYGVVAGLGRLLDALEEFHFGPAELGWLASQRVVSPQALAWLADFRFSGHVDAYLEGECYFPNSPVLSVESSFGEAVLLETLVLSVLNFDTAVASAAARMVEAAQGRPIVEMGSRRVHEGGAVAAARAALLAGFASTSNLEAGRRYGLPTAGTASHAFSLVHDDEDAAFQAQLRAQGNATTLLVDTFDIDAGIEAAVRAARARGAEGPGAIRLDSGDLARLAPKVRSRLDELGARATLIVVSSDLDEVALERLRDLPIDIYGVGTKVVTGAGAPTAGFVYKLVAVADGPGEAWRAVEKRSVDKSSLGGQKRAFRLLDEQGVARDEVLVRDLADLEAVVPHHWRFRALQRRVIESGVVTAAAREPLELATARLRRGLEELPVAARQLAPGDPALVSRLVAKERAATGTP